MHHALGVLAAGVVIGVLGDVFFHGAAIGVNLPLWIGSLSLAGWVLRRAAAAEPARLQSLGLLLFFAACLAWRASPFLRFWNGVAILTAAVAISAELRERFTRAWLNDYLRSAGDLAGHLAGGLAAATARLRWPGRSESVFSPRTRAVGLGIAFAVPVVFVFGGLLTSADPVLEAFLVRVFDWDLGLAFEHVLLTLLLSWIAVGWLRSIAAPRTPVEGSPIAPPRTFGPIEIIVPIGALALMLAVFIGLQARYLFGGETVMRSTGLTYAEFARRGFFELVVLSTLVVPMLLIAQWVLDRRARSAVESFRALVTVLVGLVGLVMVSALARMRLYVAAYGLTEDRFYATAFMAWIGLVLVWFVVTELRERRNRFVTGSLLAGFAVLALLNVINPDAEIARTNIARAESGREFDAEYLGRLSLDAVPAVEDGWPGLDPAARCQIRRDLLARAGSDEDWRSWTWARARAERAIDGLIDGTCNELDVPGSGPAEGQTLTAVSASGTSPVR